MSCLSDIHCIDWNLQALPAFGWDTNPVMGIEEVVEEGFLTVFCDLIYGGGIGWMDRAELSFRESNWALVEFKSFPSSSSPTTPTGHGHPGGQTTPRGSPTSKLTHANDPRHSAILFLFEEFVPLEYRTQLASAALSKKLPIRFFPSVSRSKAWKPAQTLNGVPYVVGQVGGGSLSMSPARDEKEREFEKFLAVGDQTLKLSAGKKSMIHAPISPLSNRSYALPGGAGAGGSRAGTPSKGRMTKVGHVSSSSPLYSEPGVSFPRKMERAPSTPALSSPARPPSSATDTAQTQAQGLGTPMKRGLFSRLPGSSAKKGARQAYHPSDYDAVDFETRLTGSMDDEERPPVPEKDGNVRRMSREDSWVDILVSSNARRGMEDQSFDADPPSSGAGLGSVGRRLLTRPGAGLAPGSSDRGGRRSDPELASQEVARALAAAGPPPPDFDPDFLDSPTPIRRARSSLNAGEILEPIAPPPPMHRDHYEGEYEEETEEEGEGYGYDDRTTGEGDYEDESQDGGYFPPTQAGPAIQVQTPSIPPSTPTQTRMRALGEEEFPEPPPIRGEDIPRSGSPLSIPLSLTAKPPPKTSLAGRASVPGKKGVGSLVEMYAEKDALAQSPSSPPLSAYRTPLTSPLPSTSTSAPASRLPVRTDAKSPVPAAPPIIVPSQGGGIAEALKALEDADLTTVPMPLDPDLGRSSPARYIHGSPLHNVDEAEEED